MSHAAPAPAPVPDAPIELVPYSDSWPGLFAAEAALLKAMLKPWLVGDIQHIGSTAVPGLAAKPVIDIMAPVRGLEEALPAIAALRSLYYVHFPYKAAEMHWFCKPSPTHRTHHLHLVRPLHPELDAWAGVNHLGRRRTADASKSSPSPCAAGASGGRAVRAVGGGARG